MTEFEKKFNGQVGSISVIPKPCLDILLVFDSMQECLNNSGSVDAAEMERSFFRLTMMLHSKLKRPPHDPK
jgi:hypothetical protein